MTTPDLDTPTTLLLVDDDERLRDRLARALTRRGYEVHQAANAAEALAIARQDSPERAIVDLRMDGPSGLELIRDLKEIDPTTAIVMLTGYGSIATAIDAVRLGATYYVQKPATTDEILAAFDRGEHAPLSGAEVAYETPSLERREWEYINQVLNDCDGNISRAAKRLNLHRRTLQRKLQRYAPNR